MVDNTLQERYSAAETHQMEAKHILVVEDDAAIRRGLADALTFSGYEVLTASEGLEGCKLALQSTCDLVLLDLILPGMSGFEILQAIREKRPVLPVIILTARGEEDDRVRGLGLGADDYVVKPFSVRELLARVDAVLRRSPERPEPISKIELPKGTADLSRREVRFDDGERVELSTREAELLGYLASQAGRAISREEILQRVWRLEPRRMETRTIDMHIASLRGKLRDDADEPKVLLTVRGKGYMVVARDEARQKKHTR
jgi:DNA-binding response OmpR family regulator